MPILQRHTKADKVMQDLMEDIKHGRLRKELDSSGYKECFQELSVQKGVMMRGERVVIPKTLIPDVLQAAHMGHPGKESMTRQLRRSCWWPKYSSDIRDFQESCIPCMAAVDWNTTPPCCALAWTIPNHWSHLSILFRHSACCEEDLIF